MIASEQIGSFDGPGDYQKPSSQKGFYKQDGADWVDYSIVNKEGDLVGQGRAPAEEWVNDHPEFRSQFNTFKAWYGDAPVEVSQGKKVVLYVIGGMAILGAALLVFTGKGKGRSLGGLSRSQLRMKSCSRRCTTRCLRG